MPSDKVFKGADFLVSSSSFIDNKSPCNRIHFGHIYMLVI